jgi:hypothetical protein
MKDYLYKEVFNNVYNLFTEKNANDLLNENNLELQKESNPLNNEKLKKKQKSKFKKKKTENLSKKQSSDIKKNDSSDDKERELQKDLSNSNSDKFERSYKSNSKKSKSYDDLIKCFFHKDQKFCVLDNELTRWDPSLEYDNDLFNQEMLIKRTVSKVLNNIYISLGEGESVYNSEEIISDSKKDYKNKKSNKKGRKKTNKKPSKNLVELEKTDTDTEHSIHIQEPNKVYETKLNNLIEMKEIEKSIRNKTCEKKKCDFTSKFPQSIEIKPPIQQNQFLENEIILEKVVSEQEINSRVGKQRDKSKKKKHRQKYKTNNNNPNKNQLKQKKEIEIDIMKSNSNITSTHSLPEKKGSFDKKDPNDYRKYSTKNIISNNFDISIIGEKEKNDRNFSNYYNENNKNYTSYSNIANEDLRKSKAFGTSYNKFNNFGGSGSSYQYFNKRNLNYNRYMDEASTVINQYNINFNVNIMNSFNILNKIEGFYPNFHFQLHNELLEYSNNVNEMNVKLKEIKMYSISYVENLVKQILRK